MNWDDFPKLILDIKIGFKINFHYIYLYSIWHVYVVIDEFEIKIKPIFPQETHIIYYFFSVWVKENKFLKNDCSFHFIYRINICAETSTFQNHIKHG